MTTPPTPTLTCEADTSSRHSIRAHACGLPATAACRQIQAYDRTERLEARCAKHAGIIKRTRRGGELVDLTPEVIDAIATRQAAAEARRAAERTAERERAAIRLEAARVEAHELDAVAWTAVRADEQTFDTWTVADGPVYRDVPRWEVRRDGGQSWDTATVKVDRRGEGWPAQIVLAAPSRLTRRQAIALAEALLAAAGPTA